MYIFLTPIFVDAVGKGPYTMGHLKRSLLLLLYVSRERHTRIYTYIYIFGEVEKGSPSVLMCRSAGSDYASKRMQIYMYFHKCVCTGVYMSPLV